MELHTLGVNGGYTQKDATEFAKVLTGWSIKGVTKKFPLMALNTASDLNPAYTNRAKNLSLGVPISVLG